MVEESEKEGSALAKVAEDCPGPRSWLETAIGRIGVKCPGIMVDQVFIDRQKKPMQWSASITVEGCEGKYAIGPFVIGVGGSVAQLERVLRDVWKHAHEK